MESLRFVNYKAFDEGEMELRPLTLLLGANSSGKSSILHLLLMLDINTNALTEVLPLYNLRIRFHKRTV